jgi:LasA protease
LLRRFYVSCLFSLMCLTIVSCVRMQPEVFVITDVANEPSPVAATLDDLGTEVNPPTVIEAIPETAIPSVVSTQNEPPQMPSIAGEYSVQPGDTLSGIADANGVSLESLLSINNLSDPNILSVGQIIKIPAPPNDQTSNFKIIPDDRLVRAPGSATFDIDQFVSQQPGYIHLATDIVNDQLLTAAQVVRRVSLEYSVDARLLLALLEHKAGWLHKLDLDDTSKTYPLEGQPSPPGFDRSGLYKQLTWAANQLNRGYYRWKYGNENILEFEESGIRLRFASDLNAGTVGVQYFLSQNADYLHWTQEISPEGFYNTYYVYFGDPFINAVSVLGSSNLVQPSLSLPFAQGQTWFFTGGPHGGWGSGSAWSAVDFAPPDDRPENSSTCYVSENWATAVAAGVIARSEDGSVILDLDMDADEATGWTILYLHMASDGRVPVGTSVQTGDHIGRPSCEGGFSNGTHMHIARRYNGEWLPVSCEECAPEVAPPTLVMGDWTFYGLPNQEYQGYMMAGSEQRTAEQGRLTPINQVSW